MQQSIKACNLSTEHVCPTSSIYCCFHILCRIQPEVKYLKYTYTLQEIKNFSKHIVIIYYINNYHIINA